MIPNQVNIGALFCFFLSFVLCFLNVRYSQNWSTKLIDRMEPCLDFIFYFWGSSICQLSLTLWIGERLIELVFLKSNKFYGSTPVNLYHLIEIQILILDISQNDLSGAIPPRFENYIPMVQKAFDERTTISIAYNPIPSSTRWVLYHVASILFTQITLYVTPRTPGSGIIVV